MGLIRTVLWSIPPAMGGCLYLAYRLGPELPRACRKSGNYLGLGYRYFKVALTVLKPVQESGEMLHLWNKSGIHVKAFARDTRLNYLDMRMRVRGTMPAELLQDPFAKFRLEIDAPEPLAGITSGAQIIRSVRAEQARCELKLRAARVEKRFREEF